MRVMVLVKATKESEAGVMPKRELLEAMTKFNEELAASGVLLEGEGLHPTAKGARVLFSGKSRSVGKGPFVLENTLAGYWVWQVRSLEEAIGWVKRCPNPHDGESEIEIRPIFEADDFGVELTPELRAKEEQLREQTRKLA